MSITDDGLVVSFDLAALLGNGHLRRLITDDARRSGIDLPLSLHQFLTECEHVRRAVDATDVSRGGQAPFPEREGVSVNEFATAIGVSVQAVRARCRRGTLSCWRDDRGAWRISRDELESA